MDIQSTIKATVEQVVSKYVTKPPTTHNGSVETVVGNTANVLLDGGAEPTPCSMRVSCRPGERVSVTIEHHRAYVTGNLSAPPTDDTKATIARAIADAAIEAADAAQTAADEAASVAEATDQHFFTDTDGVHVTEAEGDATTDHNILINSLGIMLRKATNYLVSITSSAIAFYDGLGTAASNITAQFGANLARIGYEAGKHVDVTEDGLGIYDGDTQVASFGENLVEIGTDPMLSAGMASSVVSMTGGSFQIASSINPLGGGRRTNVEVFSDGGRQRYLSFIDGLSHIDLWSVGTSEHGAADFIAGVHSVDEAGAAFVKCSTDGTVGASETKIKGDSIEMDGPVTASSSVSATSFSGAGSSLTGLNGSNISSGTVAAARIANLPASKITSGTFGASRLPLATLDSQGAMSAEMYRRVYHIDVGSGTTPVLTVRTPNDNGAQWQMGINPTSGAVNVRAYNGSAWSAWKTIATVSWS